MVTVMHDDFMFAKAAPADAAAVHALYQSLVGTPGCSWVEQYPDLEIVASDILNGDTYIVRAKGGQIVAAIAIGEDDGDEPDSGDFGWTLDLRLPCMLARLGVAPETQGRGLAGALARYALECARERGFDGARLMVTHEALAARAIYKKLGFEACGNVEMYGESFICMERAL